MPDYATRVVRFGIFEVDLRAGELRRNGIKVKVQNQPFQILAMLLERPEEIVTRDEMRARLWPAETFVDFDHGLNSAIRRLRDALRDSADRPTYVETLGRRGYRFIFPVDPPKQAHANPGLAVVAPISPHEPAPTAAKGDAVRRDGKRRFVIGFAAAIGLLAVVSAIVSTAPRIRQFVLRLVSGPDTVASPAVTERQLTANPADLPVTSAAISPDGRYLAYIDRTGFYMRQVGSGETHAVQLPADFRPQVDSWFPDGDHLVVTWRGPSAPRPGLWALSMMGGTPRRLTADGSSGRVSPDGSQIAFLRSGIERNELWIMQADGGQPQRLVAAPDAGQQWVSPLAWSPDGRRAAIVRTEVTLYNAAERRAQRTIEIVDMASGRTQVVLSNPELEEALSWADDRSILYALRKSVSGQNHFELWRLWLDVRTARPQAPGTRLISGNGAAAEFSVTRDGKLLAMRRLEQQFDVYITDIEPGGKRLSSPRRLTLDDSGDFGFAWTPDSKSVVMLSDRDGPIHIFKQAIDQPQPELMVGGNEALAIPRINPSGTELLYLVMPKPGDGSQNVRIMRMPLQGGPPQLVLEHAGIWNHQCARSPATLCIFSPTGGAEQRFFAFDPETGVKTEIVSAKFKRDVEFPNWNLSVDGKYLASRILRPNSDAAIRIVSIANGSQTTIPLVGWPATIGIDWSADTKNLWIAGLRQKTSAGGPPVCVLLRVDLDGAITTAAEMDGVCFLAGVPSPDGRHLALEGAKADSSNVWLLENF